MKKLRSKSELKKTHSPNNIKRKMIQKMDEETNAGDDEKQQQNQNFVEYRSSSTSPSMNSSMKYSQTIIMAVVEVRHEPPSSLSQNQQKLTSKSAPLSSLRDEEFSIELIHQEDVSKIAGDNAKDGVGDKIETFVLKRTSDELAAVRSHGDGDCGISDADHLAHLDLDAIETDPTANVLSNSQHCDTTEPKNADTITMEKSNLQPSPLIRC